MKFHSLDKSPEGTRFQSLTVTGRLQIVFLSASPEALNTYPVVFGELGSSGTAFHCSTLWTNRSCMMFENVFVIKCEDRSS